MVLASHCVSSTWRFRSLEATFISRKPSAMLQMSLPDLPLISITKAGEMTVEKNAHFLDSRACSCKVDPPSRLPFIFFALRPSPR